LRKSKTRVFVILLALYGIGIPTVASAHGPTIEISHDELSPGLLNLFVGTTVHFMNTVAMPGGHVVVDESGMIKSPPLKEPGDGWHYTFEKAGTYEIYMEQHPTAKARVVVVPKK
jgi:plastocyanin